MLSLPEKSQRKPIKNKKQKKLRSRIGFKERVKGLKTNPKTICTNKTSPKRLNINYSKRIVWKNGAFSY